MKKSFYNTLTLLVVFIGLLAWYLVYEKRIKPAQTEKEEQSKVILATPQDAVQELILAQRQGDKPDSKYRVVRFKKSGSDWQMVEPIDDIAEQSAVSGMLSSLTGTKYDRIVDDKPKDLEPYGLKTPKLKLTIKKDSASAPEELWVGNDTPVGNSVFVKVVGKDAVYRAPPVLRSSFDKDPSEYRNKKILSLLRNDIQEVEIKTPKEDIIFKRGDADKWTLAREGLPASDTEINKTLNSILDMRANGFAADKVGAEPLTRFGLAPASATFIFKKKDGQTLVSFGKTKDKYFAKRGDKDVVYEIPKDVFEKTQRPAKEYRDLKVAHFNRFDVKRIKLERGPTVLELTKEATDWKVTGDPKAKVDTTKVEDYLTRLQDITLKDYLPASAKPVSADLVIHLFEKKGTAAETESLTLTVSKPVAGSAMARRNNLDRPFKLDEPEFKKINAFKQEFLAIEKPPENKVQSGKS